MSASLLTAYRTGNLALNVGGRKGGVPYFQNGQHISRATTPRAFFHSLPPRAVQEFSQFSKDDEDDVLPHLRTRLSPADETYERRTSSLPPKTRTKDYQKVNAFFDDTERLTIGGDYTKEASFGSTEFPWKVVRSFQDTLNTFFSGPSIIRKDLLDTGHRYMNGMTVSRSSTVLSAFINDPLAGLYFLLSFPAGTQFVPAEQMEEWIKQFQAGQKSWMDIRNELKNADIKTKLDNYTNDMLKSKTAPNEEESNYLCFGGMDFVEFKGYTVTKSGSQTIIEVEALTIDGLHNLSGIVRWIILYDKRYPDRMRCFWYGVGDADDPRADGANNMISKWMFFEIPERALDIYEMWQTGHLTKGFYNTGLAEPTKRDFVRKLLTKLQQYGGGSYLWIKPTLKHFDPPKSASKKPPPDNVESSLFGESSETQTVCIEITQKDLHDALKDPDGFLKKLEDGTLKKWNTDKTTKPGLYLNTVPVTLDVDLYPLSVPAKAWKLSEAKAVSEAVQKEVKSLLTATALTGYRDKVRSNSQKLYENATNKKVAMAPLEGEATDVQALPPDLYDIETICMGLIDHGVLDDVREELHSIEEQVMEKLSAEAFLQQFAKASTPEDKKNSLRSVVQLVVMASALMGDNAWLLATTAASATKILLDMVSQPGPLNPEQDIDLSQQQVNYYDRELKSAEDRDQDTTIADYHRSWWQQRLDNATVMQDLSEGPPNRWQKKSNDIMEEITTLEDKLIQQYLDNLATIIENECRNGAAMDPPEKPQTNGTSGDAPVNDSTSTPKPVTNGVAPESVNGTTRPSVNNDSADHVAPEHLANGTSDAAVEGNATSATTPVIVTDLKSPQTTSTPAPQPPATPISASDFRSDAGSMFRSPSKASATVSLSPPATRSRPTSPNRPNWRRP